MTLAHVYLFDPIADEIRYQPMRLPGGIKSTCPRLQHVSGTSVPLTLGKDTRGLIEEVIVQRGHAVFFVATPEKDTKAVLCEQERKTRILAAKKHVRMIELATLELEDALAKQDETSDDERWADSSYVIHFVVADTYTNWQRL